MEYSLKFAARVKINRLIKEAKSAYPELAKRVSRILGRMVLAGN